jgi:oligopeptidase B
MPILYDQKNIQAPVAKKIPVKLKLHQDNRVDNYFWMRLTDDQKNAEIHDDHTKEVISYLDEENAYKEKMMGPLKKLEDKLFNEIIGRIKQTDMSVPYLENGFIYTQKYDEGKEYPVISRVLDGETGKETILLDVNLLAASYPYYNLKSYKVSPNNKIIAYSEDTVSRRQYAIRFKNIESGELLQDQIPNTEGSIVWANDNKTIFYAVRDESLRPYKIFKHVLGNSIDEDVEVYHEKDSRFISYVYKTKSQEFIIIGSHANTSREFRYIPANTPELAFKIFQARESKHEYHIDHVGEKWYIVSNQHGAINFKLYSTVVGKTESKHWHEEIPHREDVLIEGLELFEEFLVLLERINGVSQLRVISSGREDYYISFKEPVFMVFPAVNKDIYSKTLRFRYTSLTTPMSTYDYNLITKERVLLKQQEVVGEFDQSAYQSERVYVTAKDGATVPVSLVYKKGFEKNGKAPLLLYGYGSYGHSIDTYFSSNRLSLLNRGFVFAIAHIRGGQELGRQWYDNGKLIHKKNTFTDFIDCAEYLIINKYTSSTKLFGMGGSAGGLLIGAVMNMRPELWGGLIAAVPFVDVLSTMMDDTIPLTTGEYDEWGNPNDEFFYHYIKSYSPYDNIEPKDYPPLLVTTGLHDSQVQYWEPAKWVAKLRDLKTDTNPLLLHCNMETGHGGASGRFKVHKETAMDYAFLLDLAGIKD